MYYHAPSQLDGDAGNAAPSNQRPSGRRTGRRTSRASLRPVRRKDCIEELQIVGMHPYRFASERVCPRKKLPVWFFFKVTSGGIIEKVGKRWANCARHTAGHLERQFRKYSKRLQATVSDCKRLKGTERDCKRFQGTRRAWHGLEETARDWKGLQATARDYKRPCSEVPLVRSCDGKSEGNEGERWWREPYAGVHSVNVGPESRPLSATFERHPLVIFKCKASRKRMLKREPSYLTLKQDHKWT